MKSMSSSLFSPGQYTIEYVRIFIKSGSSFVDSFIIRKLRKIEFKRVKMQNIYSLCFSTRKIFLFFKVISHSEQQSKKSHMNSKIKLPLTLSNENSGMVSFNYTWWIWSQVSLGYQKTAVTHRRKLKIETKQSKEFPRHVSVYLKF